jgi:hypothetical protein
MFIFTIYKTVGETAELAFSGMCGTFCACFNIWVMFGVFPDGVTENSGSMVWWFGVIDAVVYIIVIVGVHCSPNLKMFALNWHCYFIMSFLNPAPVPFSTGFSLRLTGPAVSAFLMSSIGAGMAVICTLMPFPLFALDKARTSAVDLTSGISAAWNAAAAAIMSPTSDDALVDEFQYHVRSIAGGVNSMNGFIASSWWECLGVGKPEGVRDSLRAASDPLKLLYDRLCGVRNILTSSSAPFNQQIMSTMEPHIKRVCEGSGTLLRQLVMAAVDGTMDEQEKVDTAAAMTEVKEACAAMAGEFKKVSQSGDLIRENALLLMIASYGSIVIETGNVMIRKMNGEVEPEKPKLSDATDKLIGVKLWDDPMYRNCFLRSVSAILICFGAGYNGYSAIFPSYNAYPAATVSLLLSSGLTAQIDKNMVRLQGVLFGGVLGQIAYALMAWCSLTGYILTVFYCFLWSTLTLLMYFNSGDSKISLLGCLVSAFGLGGYLKGCSNEVFTTNSSYGIVVSLVFLICAKIVVDCIMARNSASAEATTALCGAWSAYRNAWAQFCNPEMKLIYYHAESLKEMFQGAMDLGLEANQEPRGVKTQWKGDLFASVGAAGQSMCESLSNMEASFSQTGKDGGEKSETLQDMMKSEAFLKVKADLENRLICIEELCRQAFLHATQDHFGSQYKPIDASKDIGEESVKSDLKGLSDALLKGEADKAGSVEDNLEMSTTCKLSVTMFTITRQLDFLRNIERSILATA